jgi:chemotaxis protein methyltransferase CheR
MTKFFRNPQQFQMFEYFVIPNILKKKAERGDYLVRAWSAGCSSGEEAYSMAILFNELLPADFKAEIWATDVSESALSAVRKGIYPKSLMNGIAPRFFPLYFDRIGDKYEVKDSLRACLRTRLNDIRFDSGISDIDVVFCRNVLIYLDEPERISALQNIAKAMALSSYLLLGKSELHLGYTGDFKYIRTDWGTLFQN